MPHWRSFVSNAYVCAADLFDERTETFREVTVTIEKVTGGEIIGEGGRKTKRPFVYFAGSKTDKPLGLNSTNSKAIEQIAGSGDVKRWVGLRLVLFVTKTRDPNGSGMVDCIRVRAPAKSDGTAPEPDHPAKEAT